MIGSFFPITVVRTGDRIAGASHRPDRKENQVV